MVFMYNKPLFLYVYCQFSQGRVFLAAISRISNFYILTFLLHKGFMLRINNGKGVESLLL